MHVYKCRCGALALYTEEVRTPLACPRCAPLELERCQTSLEALRDVFEQLERLELLGRGAELVTAARRILGPVSRPAPVSGCQCLGAPGWMWHQHRRKRTCLACDQIIESDDAPTAEASP